MTDDAAYEAALGRYRRVVALDQARDLLSFDRDVWMPEGGDPARARQLAALESLRSELLADDDLGALLDRLADADLSDEQAAVVREIRLEHEREANVPDDLAGELDAAQSAAADAHERAREADDFAPFVPHLETLRDRWLERVENVAPDRSPYAAMFAEREPHVSLATVDRLFARLREELVPLAAAVRDSPVDLATPLASERPESAEPQVPAETVHEVTADVFDLLGYDWDRGLFVTGGHPQTTGNQYDARVKVPEKPAPASVLLRAVTGTVHEFGHAAYDLGLSRDRYGTPLGEPRRGVHEAMARFWENHVARSEPFWERVVPVVRRHVDGIEGLDELTPRAAYESVNRVRPDNPYRVRADNVTYHLHVLVRCEIDRAFVAGDVEAAEIAEVWNERTEEYLGIRPETHAAGCLQDRHWAYGFACFQEYTLGSVVAAQIDAAIRDDLAVDDLVRDGDFEPIHEWLTERVHRHGRRYPTDELIEVATGESLRADPFLDHVHAKFGALYDL